MLKDPIPIIKNEKQALRKVRLRSNLIPVVFQKNEIPLIEDPGFEVEVIEAE